MPFAATLIAALGARAGAGSAEKAEDEPTVAAAARQIAVEVFMFAALVERKWKIDRMVALSDESDFGDVGEVFLHRPRVLHSKNASCVACCKR